MSRYILRFVTSGRDTAKNAIVERLHASPDVIVVEETPSMVLVEAADDALRRIVNDADDVVILPERHYRRPNPPLTVENDEK